MGHDISSFILKSEHKRILESAQARHDANIGYERAQAYLVSGITFGVIGFIAGMVTAIAAVSVMLGA